jgi:hypothetical protein
VTPKGNVMSNLFEKIKKGTIMIWDVKDQKELPKIREMGRLLGLKDFTYYKTDGHHSDYIRLILKMREARSAYALQEEWQYWPKTKTSHFLFTAEELESTSLFVLHYFSKCLGSYFVSDADLMELRELNRNYSQMRGIAEYINTWPGVISDNQRHLTAEGITDTVIQTFDTPALLKLIEGYGHEAIQSAVSKLDAWHQKHFWKSKPPNWVPTEPEEQEITT